MYPHVVDYLALLGNEESALHDAGQLIIIDLND